MKGALNKISVKGYKSIKHLEGLVLSDLNIVIGANGSGKSNFVQIFRMLMAMSQKNFGQFILQRGGADSFLFNGPKVTSKIQCEFEFESHSSNAIGSNSYQFDLIPTVDEKFLISEERKYVTTSWRSYGGASEESRLNDQKNEKSRDDKWNGVGYFVYESIASWMVYHFHDTSATSPMRRSEIIDDCKLLRGDASNIAPFLLNMRINHQQSYTNIINTIRLVMPFFDDLLLDVQTFGEAEKTKLSWMQKGSDYPMQPYHFSDGSIRFICLATALLQPNPPSTIIIDEPELGLHPAAIVILAELIQQAAQRTQVIIATQSPALIDQFTIDDIIVVNRKGGASDFKRLDPNDFSEWLKDYSVGELWHKNVIAGGPVYE
jgi:predicted ATPase